MDKVEANIANFGEALLRKIPIAGLLKRNPIAYKWKSTYAVWMVRELTMWREHDLLAQSYLLHQQGHGLGARVLLRSAFETLATLIYLNMLIQQVLDGKLKFHEFSQIVTVLLLGARNNDEMPQAINIVTVLGKCNKRYPGLMELYGNLSESAHPNYEGLMEGYSKTDYDEYETTFSNRWMELHGAQHPDQMMLCMSTFHHEYNDVWPALVEDFEKWIEANDDQLEATKGGPVPAEDKSRPPS